jgi:uncharacterized membrane protein YeaQ/YmgE (transglycosylase-associated protein family)
MNFVYWVIFGGIIGWLASILTHNNSRQGIIMDVVVGLIGSILGGWLASVLGGGDLNILTISGFIFSLVGAVVFLIGFHYIRERL